MLEILYLALGIIIGISLTIWAEFLAMERENIVKRIKGIIPNKKGYIVGLSEEEENFKNSLKTNEDTKIK